jgi:hypothetical protein
MKIYREMILSFILVILSVPSVNADIMTTKIVKENLSKIVMIITFDSNDQPLSIGSGFYISDDGAIATNYHVIESAASAIIKEIGSSKKFSVDSVVNLNSEYDIAILKINKSTVSVRIGDEDKLIVGENIVAIGNPEGLEGTVSEGIISGFRKINDDFRIMQITAPISPGSSGGPVFNNSGEVIGIATASFTSGQNLNFAIPITSMSKIKSEKPINLKLNQINFPILSKKKNEIINTKERELVRVIDYSYGTQYVGGSGIFDFSIYNGTLHDIKSTKIVILFFKSKWDDRNKKTIKKDDIPIHYEAYEIKDNIPSRLSKRISRTISPIESNWIADFRVLDYTILPSSGNILFK